MSSKITNEKKIKAALQFMINHKSPYLIHCFAGIDRTGFFIMLLEALMGASMKEIITTYLSALPNDKNILESLNNHCQVSGLLKQMKSIFYADNLFKINIQSVVEQYLMCNINLSHDEIIQLKKILKG